MPSLNTPEDINPYLHPIYGVVSNAPHVGTDRAIDNYFYFSAHWFNVLKQAGLHVPPSQAADWDEYCEACELEPGLFDRYPEYWDLCSHDELTGIAFVDSTRAFEIHAYGKNHWWSWNNSEPGKWTRKSYFGRFIDFVPFLVAAKGGRINFIQQILWSLATWHSATAPREDTGGKLIKYLHLPKMLNQGWIVRLAIRDWQRRMSKMYPGGVREVFSIYFTSTHPITKYARDDFEIKETT